MKRQEYTTKTGKKQFMPVISSKRMPEFSLRLGLNERNNMKSIKDDMANGKIKQVIFTYIGYGYSKKGDCFVGGGGGLYHWAWDEESKNKHRLYRAEEVNLTTNQ